MSCEIIQFSAAARTARPVTDKQAGAGVTAIGDRALTPIQRRREKPELPPPATETAKNSRIRAARRDTWRRAGRVADYWRARLDWHSELRTAQKYGIADSASFPSTENENRYGLVEKWREAVVKKLLTPAADLAAITWKRAKLESSEFPHLPVKKERVERAIADDVAWLAAHPTMRTGNVDACAARRAFKEAMRQRIREIAASRDLTDEEIKPVLGLKHHEIGASAVKHSVSLAWLLEGAGPIFKKYPDWPRPEMTGDESAAVVTTMPTADQQAIRTMVREILQERDQ
jgi:hypothetical protein